MKRRLLPLLYLSLWLPLAAMAAIYQTKDENGNIIYTDMPPQENAEEIALPELNVLETERPKSETRTAPTQSHKKSAPNRTYERLTISAPGNDAVIRSNQGQVSINVTLSPALSRQDTLYIELDGKQVNDGKAASVTLENVDRGSHTVSAYIRQADGQQAIAAEQIVFHLKRHSALN